MISAVGSADYGASATRMLGCDASDGADGGAIVFMLAHRGQRASLPIQHRAADDADGGRQDSLAGPPYSTGEVG